MTYPNRFPRDSDHTPAASHSFTLSYRKQTLSHKGAALQELRARVLVVEDHATWSHFLCSTLEQSPRLEVVSVVSNGLDAVEKAKQLTADLILLDIGLPELDGIEAALRIRAFAPQSKILFISENRDPDIVQEALNTGA